MARVAWIILSEENTGGNELIIHNPITSIILGSINEKFSFMLTFSLMELTKTDNYKIDIEIGEVGGNILINMSSDLGFQYKKPFDIFTNEISIQDFTFSNEGIHYVRLTIDKEHTQEIYFKVRVEEDSK